MSEPTTHYRTDAMVARALAPVASEPAESTAAFHVHKDGNSSSDTTLKNGQIAYSASEDNTVNVSGSWRAEEDDRVRRLVAQAIEDREARENVRANHRNLNRMLTLFGALFIGLFVTWALVTPGIVPQSWHFLAPYSFVITILMDSGLALYGYIKHY